MAKFDYDNKTLRSMFGLQAGKTFLPKLTITLEQITQEVQKLAGKLSISGVQPKLSVQLDEGNLIPVAKDGLYILKPQTQNFAQLPQNEFLCMQMAKRYGLNTAECLLVELADQTPAYLVKRFDRFKKGRQIHKLACEDMHQILGGTSKYAGSHEQIASAIKAYCSFPPLELQRLFELVLFNFAIGNGDAHRKNFSLLTDQRGHVALSPAYDLVSSRLAIPHENEELALTVNGKRNRLTRADFTSFAEHLGISDSYAKLKIIELLHLKNEFVTMVKASSLSEDLRDRLVEILDDRFQRLA